MRARTHREIERKYDATRSTGLPSWAQVAGGQEPVAQDQQLRATYLDTADLRLAQARITLRYRTGDDENGWHLKLPAGKDTRDEVQFPPQAGDGETEPGVGPPAELADLIRAFTGGSPLAPIARLRTNRRLLRWVDADGRKILEVTDDRVSAVVLPAGADSTWREIEVELGAEGDLALLKRADRVLRGAGVQRSASASKLARALGDRAPTAPAAPSPQGCAAQAPLAYLRTQVAAIRRYDVEVRREADDAVHQFRVATRRARSALQAYGHLIDRERTRGLTEELKWLAGTAGHARDLEVLQARFTEAVAAQDVANVLGPVKARLELYFSPLREQGRGSLLAALNGERYAALLANLDALVADPPLTARARKPAVKVLPAEIARVVRRVRRHLDTAAGGGPDRDIELHEARKAAKRLRYAAEAAEPVLGKPSAKLVKHTKTLQTILGEHQDAVVAAPTLRELAISAQLAGESAFTFGVLYGEEATTGVDEAGLASAWEAVRKAAAKIG